MSSTSGSKMQSFNNELVQCIGDLRTKRDDLGLEIEKGKEEKAKVQADLKVLSDRLSRLNEQIQRKTATMNEYTRTIQESENAFEKIMESSQTLLTVLKRESHSLAKHSN
ncbi:hypothetical protein PCE1_003613 [Barthelona sp. PCE]